METFLSLLAVILIILGVALVPALILILAISGLSFFSAYLIALAAVFIVVVLK